jgi:hypothetical protein
MNWACINLTCCPLFQGSRDQDDGNLDIEGSDSETAQKPDDTPASKRRKFKPEWKTQFPWLMTDDRQEKLFCSLCRAAEMKNTFGTCGSTTQQYSSLTRHSSSEDHRRALVAEHIGTPSNIDTGEAVLAVASITEQRTTRPVFDSCIGQQSTSHDDRQPRADMEPSNDDDPYCNLLKMQKMRKYSPEMLTYACKLVHDGILTVKDVGHILGIRKTAMYKFMTQLYPGWKADKKLKRDHVRQAKKVAAMGGQLFGDYGFR